MEKNRMTRRHAAQTIGLVGTGIVGLPSLARMAHGAEKKPRWPAPLQVVELPQPPVEANAQVNFGSRTGRMAVVGGLPEKGDVYVQASARLFDRIWTCEGAQQCQIFAVAWSPSETALAFLAQSVAASDDPATGELALYVASGETLTVRKALTIERYSGTVVDRIQNVDAAAGVAWYDEESVCLAAGNGQMLIVNIVTGAEATVGPAAKGTVFSLRHAGPRKVAFLRRTEPGRSTGAFCTSGQLTADSVTEIDGPAFPDIGDVVMCRLDQDGTHLLLHTLREGLPFIAVGNTVTGNIVHEAVGFARDSSFHYAYIPITVRDHALILRQATMDCRIEILGELMKDPDIGDLIRPETVARIRPKCRLVAMSI